MSFSLDRAATSHLLGPSSPLAPFLTHFEHRPEQQAMLSEIVEAFNEQRILVTEAGTGVGKSLAYLIPALLWAKKSGERVVISTHTIALQEQLLQKDLPDLLDALELDISCTLVKGMHHYLCLSRLFEAIDHHPPFSTLGAKLRAIEANGKSSESDLLNIPSIRCEREHCNGPRCANFNSCHFYKARTEAENAEVLIVNHHLLLLDYLRREEDPSSGILPNYSRLIVDEAHHLDKVATHIFAKRLSLSELSRTLGELAEKDIAPSLTKTTYEIQIALTKFSAPFEEKLSLEKAPLPSREIIEALRQKLIGLEIDLTTYANTLKEPMKTELGGYAKKCVKSALLIEELLLSDVESESVRWAESTRSPLPSYCESLIDPSEKLRHFLSEPASALLTSATLTNGGNFDYFLNRIGYQAGEVETSRHKSPFDFEKQSALFIPTDLPLPDDPAFIDKAAKLIESTVAACQGGVFILCTSYRQLNELFETLEALLSNYTLLKQGDKSRTALLNEFKQSDRPVLFATSSFWEGVDVAGKIRAVIIPKIPFQVPTDPHTQALYRLIESKGRSAFTSYTLPEAEMRLTQGLGRLIRSSSDRGVAICLDVRLHSRGYGKKLLQATDIPKRLGSSEQVVAAIEGFWRELRLHSPPQESLDIAKLP